MVLELHRFRKLERNFSFKAKFLYPIFHMYDHKYLLFGMQEMGLKFRVMFCRDTHNRALPNSKNW